MNTLLLLALAAAPLELSYGTGPLELEKLAAVPDVTLARQIVACTKGYRVNRVERRASPPTLVWDAATDALADLSRAERIGLLSVLGRNLVGSEADILVPAADGTSTPVSVTWAPDGAVTFESGPAVKSLVDETMTAERIKSQFDVGEFLEVDAKWDGASYSLVQQALSSLTTDELAMVGGLRYRRVKANGVHAAMYERGDTSNWVNVYDVAFVSNKELFTGPVTAPRPQGLITLIHELGHALADVRFREKGVRSKAAADAYALHRGDADVATARFNERAKALGPNPTAKGAAELKALDAALTTLVAENDARFKEADRLVKQLLANDKANAKGRPVELAFAAILDPKQSPTAYGKKSAKEHFAECFTVFRNDPDALRRISAAAADWFAAGTHVGIAGKPVD